MKHDPYPLVIVTDLIYGRRIRGVNLNYLTFNNIKKMLGTYGDNKAFSYQNIKNDVTVGAAVHAFRTYKWLGVRQLRKLDTEFLLQTIDVARSYDPAEMQAMRKAVQEQIQQKVSPKADEIAEPDALYNQQPTPQQAVGTTGTTPPVPATPISQQPRGPEGNQ